MINSDNVPYIFLSYARDDLSLATGVASHLTTAGAKVFFDRDSISPGAQWTERIHEALRECHAMIFLVSTASSQSSYVQQELGAAIINDKRVVPLLIRDVDAMPGWTNNFQCLDLRDQPDDFCRRTLRNLVASLEELPRMQTTKKTREKAEKIAGEFKEAYVSTLPLVGPIASAYKMFRLLGRIKNFDK